MGADDAAPIALSRLAAGYGDAEADCQIRVDERRRRSGRALDIRLREIFTFVEKRSAAELGLSAAFQCSRLGVASDSPVRIGATADASTTITSRR